MLIQERGDLRQESDRVSDVLDHLQRGDELIRAGIKWPRRRIQVELMEGHIASECRRVSFDRLGAPPGDREPSAEGAAAGSEIDSARSACRRRQQGRNIPMEPADRTLRQSLC